jgi:hypothetical protein
MGSNFATYRIMPTPTNWDAHSVMREPIEVITAVKPSRGTSAGPNSGMLTAFMLFEMTSSL